MSDYLEPNTGDDQGTESLPLPPSGANQGPRSLNPERVRHMLYGSLAAIERTIKILHALGYADPNDWSDPIPVPPSAASLEGIVRASGGVEMWMVILTKTLFME
ncbi:MAG: hypothetical protein WBB18_06085 [Nodosilinea sp.]